MMAALSGAVSLYMYVFGVLKSFSLYRMGYARMVLCIVGALCTVPFNIITENVAVIRGLFGNTHRFYVVSKQVNSGGAETLTV